VIDELIATESAAMAYIYFDYNDPKSQEPETVIRSLLKQLLFKPTLLIPELESLYDECIQKGKSADMSTLRKHMISICSYFQSIIILFDALDECTSINFRETAEIICELRKTEVKVFSTSRINTPQIREKLGNPLVIEIQANQEDIINYISIRLDKEWDYDEESREKISDSLIVNAKGKFTPITASTDLDSYLSDFNWTMF
jgi:hypothetical protein